MKYLRDDYFSTVKIIIASKEQGTSWPPCGRPAECLPATATMQSIVTPSVRRASAAAIFLALMSNEVSFLISLRKTVLQAQAVEYFSTYICFVASCLDNVHGGVAHGNGGGRGYRDRSINTLTTGMRLPQ